MPKLIEWCGDCSLCKVVNNDCVCRYEGIYREIDAHHFPTWCPRKDGVPVPEPYSDSNPPRLNDIVLVELEDTKQIGFVECVRVETKSCNVRLAYSHPCEPCTERFMTHALTLLYRPESTP